MINQIDKPETISMNYPFLIRLNILGTFPKTINLINTSKSNKNVPVLFKQYLEMYLLR